MQNTPKRAKSLESAEERPAANNSLPRLNKYLAERLGISRRDADRLIDAGRVTINGQRAQLGNRVDKNDKILCNNELVPHEVEHVYYAFHKPTGYVCSRNRQSLTPTIFYILPDEFSSLKYVGRLDKMSSGLLLLTNDGDFAYRMTHPKFAKQKVYEVKLDKPLAVADLHKITEEGVEISDGLSKFEVAYDPMQRCNPASRSPYWKPKPGVSQYLLVTLSEGRNRQIRRTFAALGYNVLVLHRTKFGDYELGDLWPGEYREIQV